MFTWLPLFNEIARWIVQYRNRQNELCDILRKIGFEENLEDEDGAGRKNPLAVMDPFTFFSFFLWSRNSEIRKENFKKLQETIELKSSVPDDFNGVPHPKGRRPWYFRIKDERPEEVMNNLWDLSEQAVTGKLEPRTFQNVLEGRGINTARLTKGLFWLNPVVFCPVDAARNKYLKERGINIKAESLADYLDFLEKVKTTFQKPFYEVSYEAWKNKQEEDEEDDEADEFDQIQRINLSQEDMNNHEPLNQILYGPPGTGKTYHTINKSVVIANPQFDIANASREKLKAEYERLVKDGQIEFVTFHQSMSYEDFIEGIKPMEPKEGDPFLKYEIKEGIFKRLCERASKVPETKPVGFSISDDEFQKAGFYKLSLGDTSNPDDDQIYSWCIQNGYIALGYGDAIDFTGKTENEIQQMVPAQLEKFAAQAVNYFIHYLKAGDYVVITYGNLQFRAIGKVIGNYEYKNVNGLNVHQFRKVEWILKNIELPYEEVYNKQFSQQTIYRLNKREIKKEFFVKNEPFYRLTFDELYRSFLKKTSETLKQHTNDNPLYFAGRRSRIKVLSIENDKIITIGETANTEETIQKERLKQIYDKYNSPEDIQSVGDLRDINTAIGWTSNYFATFKALKDFESFFKGSSSTGKLVSQNKNYVLIIDEINRGNVSQIFGELITLIEEDKRAGKEEALTVTLPYSKKTFSVPPNLFIIGTMNTADRSVEALDTALRRRFTFQEIIPKPRLLNNYNLLKQLWAKYKHTYDGDEEWEIAESQFASLVGMQFIDKKKYIDLKPDADDVDEALAQRQPEDFKVAVEFKNGVNLEYLLIKLNERLTMLLDGDHTIGHAWLMNIFTLKELRKVFADKILPLLKEFFYNDYAKIGLVLGDAFFQQQKTSKDMFAKFKDENELADEYENKIIYTLKDPFELEIEDFQSIYQ
jgi:5-methylcytosine-specific restriction endonuclease McrBC GTP-binding regulatory subunit McrB